MTCPCPKHPFGCYDHPTGCGCNIETTANGDLEKLLVDINKAAHAAGTNAWVRDVLQRSYRAVRNLDPAATAGSAALADTAEKCALYDFDTVEMVECKWELWQDIINALRSPHSRPMQAPK